MIDQLLAELRKMRSTRTNLALLAGMVALVLLFVLVNGLAAGIDLHTEKNQHALLAVGTRGALIAALIGVMAITSEFRHGTIRPTFVVTPHRSQVLVAKVIASLLMGIAFGALAIALSFGIGYAILAGKGIHFALDTNHVVMLVLGSLAMTALWAALGVGLGALVKNQVLAVVGLILWVMLVDALLRGMVPTVGRFTPTAVSDSFTAGVENYLVSPAVGGLLLLAYTTALVAAGALAVARRDVT
jgi:ABC-2 type transport system permease protein